MKRNSYLTLIFIGLVIINVILRVLFLGRTPPSLYIDEINDLRTSQYWVTNASILNLSFTGLRVSLFEILSGNSFAVLVFRSEVNIAARFSVFIYSLLICLPLYRVSKELYGKRAIGWLSVLVWLYSPLSFFMGLYATSLELMPLFYFLIFIFFLVKLRKNMYKASRNWIYLIIVTFLLLFIRDNLAWSFLDLAFTVLMLFLYETFTKNGAIRRKFSIKQEVALLSVVFALIGAGWILLIRRLSSYLLSASLNLALLPFFEAIVIFFVRFYYFIAPYNLILLSPFPSFSLRYLPGFTPMFFLSEGIILFPTIGYSIFSLHKKKDSFQNFILLSLAVGGYLAPILSLANAPSFAVESETIFAFPALAILISVFSLRLLGLTKKRTTLRFRTIYLHYKAVALTVIIFLLALMLINVTGFFVDLSFHYNNHVVDDSNSNFYPYYGLRQSADYIVSHNLTSYPLYYYPNTSYNNWVNLTTSGWISYWFYSEGYPFQYLNEYSHGKIKSINLIEPNTFPAIESGWVIVLSQNISYSKILAKSGYSVQILYEVLRPDKQIAWQIIKVTTNLTEALEIIQNVTLANNSQNIAVTPMLRAIPFYRHQWIGASLTFS